MKFPAVRAPSRPGRVVLDVVSLLLLVAGLAGLVVVAFDVGERAGWALLSVYAVGGGLVLGIDRK